MTLVIPDVSYITIIKSSFSEKYPNIYIIGTKLLVQKFMILDQCFPTTVPWYISVLCEIIRCAMKDYPISPDWYSKRAVCTDRQNNYSLFH